MHAPQRLDSGKHERHHIVQGQSVLGCRCTLSDYLRRGGEHSNQYPCGRLFKIHRCFVNISCVLRFQCEIFTGSKPRCPMPFSHHSLCLLREMQWNNMELRMYLCLLWRLFGERLFKITPLDFDTLKYHRNTSINQKKCYCL